MEFLSAHYVSISGAEGLIRLPFKPEQRCAVLHCHKSEKCAVSTRSCFYDAGTATVYCTDRGLKGGGGGKSKCLQQKATFHDLSSQQAALKSLPTALSSTKSTFAFNACDAIFDCEQPLVDPVREIAGSLLDSRGKPWDWTGTQGELSKIHCARVLRMAAVRGKLQEALGESQRNEGLDFLRRVGKRLVLCAKSKECSQVLRAELKAALAVATMEWTQKDSDFSASLCGLNSTFSSSAVRAMSTSDVLSRLQSLAEHTSSLAQQVILSTALDFSVRQVSLPAVEFVRGVLAGSRRWVTAVLYSSIVRKWMSTAEQLSAEVTAACIDILRQVSSFRLFVYRSHWKMRSGGLWNLFALHESSVKRAFFPPLAELVAERKTIERGEEVLLQVKAMESFLRASALTEGDGQFQSVVEREAEDLAEFIGASRRFVSQELTSEKNQKGIRKQLRKVVEMYEDISRTNRKLHSQVKLIRELSGTIDCLITTQSTIRSELGLKSTLEQKKVNTVPRIQSLRDWFHGREQLLVSLRSALGDVERSKSVALLGPENIGKSWLAVKYAQEHGEEYDAVIYLSSETINHLFLAIRELAKLLNCGKLSEKETIEAVKQKISSLPRALIIYDNADSAGRVDEYMSLMFPARGHVIVTSRSYEWGEKLPRLDVTPFTKSEAQTLLAKATSFEPSERLVQMLDCAPLAVKQAAILTRNKLCPLDDFQQLLEAKMDTTTDATTAVLEMCTEALRPETMELMKSMAPLSGNCISFSVISSLRQGTEEKDALSELQSFDFVSVSEEGVTINRPFLALFPQPRSDFSQSPSLPEQERVLSLQLDPPSPQERDAEEVPSTDDFDDWEFRAQKQMQKVREKAVESTPEQRVAVLTDSANRFIRGKHWDFAERDVESALIAAGSSPVLLLSAKIVHGKLLLKRGNAPKAAEVLSEAESLLCDNSDFKAACELYTHLSLALVTAQRDFDAERCYERALNCLREDRKEMGQLLMNMAYFYQTSSRKDLDKAESVSMRAINLLQSDSSGRQLSIVYRNLAIIYGERATTTGSDSYLDKKIDCLQHHLDLRRKSHGSLKVDPELAQTYLSLGDVFIGRKLWEEALGMLVAAKEKLPARDKQLSVILNKIEAVKFYMSHSDAPQSENS